MTDTVNVPREAWAEYKRSQIAHLRPYIVGETLSERVSISMADLEAGSPKDGDMIARNPANHDDQWLVAADYFAANFEPVATAPKAEPVDAELYLQEAISSSPQPLRDLGEFLSSVLDEDHWKTADRLLLAIATSQPEAPKVEQEPSFYGHVITYHYGTKPVFVPAGEVVSVRESSTVTAVYDRPWSPAPASELLEALGRLIDRAEEVRDLLAAHPAMQGREHDSVGVAFNNAIGRAQSAYAANQKEAQS